jgi:CrcB protein
MQTFKLLLIGIGGGFGSILRYMLGRWIQALAGPDFPLSTLVINVSGCFAIGFLSIMLGPPRLVREEYRLAILVGILGGYTTFSTFGYETFMLLGSRQFAWAWANVLLSVGVGLPAVWIGYRLAERIFGV